jgi:peptidoglycan L-alanyl-D-glutamate endopeptidase CwlK
MTFRFGLRSQTNLTGVHPDLVKIAYRALELSPVDFVITEGLRSAKRQRELFAQHKSKTLASRHITGHAIDVAALINAKVTWDWAEYETIAEAFKQSALEQGLSVEWGGDWPNFRDGPHFQLPFNTYPAVSAPLEIAKEQSGIDDATRARAKAWLDTQEGKS